MSAPHFFAGAPVEGEVLTLTGDDARHAAGSLRLRAGDELTSSDGNGGLVRCVIRTAEPGRVSAEVLERSRKFPPSPSVAVHLAAPKGERLTWAVQKLTELGVDSIGILETERSVRRWSDDRGKKLAARLEAVTNEAAKQSRRRFLPSVEGPLSWDEALGRAPAATRLVLWERADVPLLEVLPEDHRGKVSIFIGPEGGISEADAGAAEGSGALLASLGPTILRTETAAIAAASVVLARYGRMLPDRAT